ncbi:hypothetical protein EON81_06840 [bacterium]|nr:MAG: hypothetical protein EON81_06840 [bacterium]
MKWIPGLLGATLLLGCASQTPPPAPVPNYTTVQPMEYKQRKAVTSYGYEVPADLVGVMEDWPQEGVSDFFKAVGKGGYRVNWTLLRNPAKALYVFKGKKSDSVTAGERREFEALAAQYKATVLTGKLPMALGPDGRTPMVMPSRTIVATRPDDQRSDFRLTLAFSKLAVAQEASKYIDRKGYSVTVRSNGDSAEVEAVPLTADTTSSDEREAFYPLAQRFKGEVWVGWTETGPVAADSAPGR